MSTANVIGLVLSSVLAVFLVVALIKPEKF
ncbi:MAG: K(+)-transporting ATPase subunit F [Hamadaea sp.]|nr:K(+)-transporting ATPase subunit F [Hamadaea sp.]NUR74188.1 K(+)-transporting ATPase subunit F [Hamadaea sp.]NUT20488.1 K(+)-transporting ATPase subunit F [Hamadaea sp.]